MEHDINLSVNKGWDIPSHPQKQTIYHIKEIKTMNREQRRNQEKENRRANSKKNFVYMGKTDIPVDTIQNNPDLKECDPDIMELMAHRFQWAEQGLISNNLSKCIIVKGCAYPDSLCSLRFDITLPDDRMLIRDTMHYVGNFTNMFYGLLIDEESEDVTLFERSQKCRQDGDTQRNALIVHELYPKCDLPNKDVVDNIYASFIADHAQKLSSFLQHTRKSDVEGDEDYLFEILNMILKKTDELLPEAQIDSKKFIVSL